MCGSNLSAEASALKEWYDLEGQNAVFTPVGGDAGTAGGQGGASGRGTGGRNKLTFLEDMKVSRQEYGMGQDMAGPLRCIMAGQWQACMLCQLLSEQYSAAWLQSFRMSCTSTGLTCCINLTYSMHGAMHTVDWQACVCMTGALPHQQADLATLCSA